MKLNTLKSALNSLVRRFNPTITGYSPTRDEPPQITLSQEIDELIKARMSLDHTINDTHSLKDQDYELIGRFVQTYCVADLEARRVINCLTHIRVGEPTTFALKLNDKNVLDHLIACADCCVWNLELSEGIRRAAEIFVQHRQLRHMFAHWAGRRFPRHEMYIFFTASLDKQKIPMTAIKFEEDDDANIQYGIMPISKLLQETEKLQGHAQYLANVGRELELNATQIAKDYAKDVAECRLESRPYIVPSSGQT